jgi:hypothetical protein
MPVCRSLAILSALLITGCTSVSAHGIIRDSEGRPIDSASVTVREATSGTTLETASSEVTGCFNLFALVKREQSRFILEAGAPGRKPVAFTFERNQRDPLLIVVAGDSAHEDSSVRALTPSERNSLYDLYCAPASVPGATSLGLR